jgi:hypothetical protein
MDIYRRMPTVDVSQSSAQPGISQLFSVKTIKHGCNGNASARGNIGAGGRAVWTLE